LEQLAEIPRLDDAWFPLALAKARVGDEEARRSIHFSSLWIVVDAVQERAGLSGTDLAKLIGEGNRTLEDALDTFAGGDVADYRAHVRQCLKARWRSGGT